ncbi:MAG: ATP-dependent DNA helicase RecG [Candidatus Omnitrophota bacterium]
MNSPLAASIQYLKGIGPKRAKLLADAGIRSVEDAFYYFPRRYQDRTHFTSIAQLEIGAMATVKAEVLSVNARRSFRKGGFNIFEVSAGDETSCIFAVWFNQPYLRNYFKLGKKVILYGKVELYKDRVQLSNPEFEFIEEGDEGAESGKIIPVYPLPKGFSQRGIRKMIASILDKHLTSVAEILPFDIRCRHNLGNIAKSLRNIHFPESEDARLAAYQRLSFEEFFIYQIPLILRKLKRKEKKGIAFKINEELLGRFIQSLPFVLTRSQVEVLSQIKADMQAPRPMQRLLQGDVGSGKTIVATIAALVAVSNASQAAFMAPTEILANQHYVNLRSQISNFNKDLKIGLLTGSLKDKERQKILKDVKDGRIDIVVGTHALIQEGVVFKKLGLIIMDEQHKFGVSQRALLPQKGVNPDVLIMTATPIPRTLSMTLFGDLDISTIRELPQGRKKIQTLLYELERRHDAYEFLRSHVKAGRQAYIIYPLIEESPTLMLASAKRMYKEFSQDIFKELKVGLVHGKLKKEEQDRVMAKFRDGALDILVATTILEVGIDVPNATVMLIEHAERFGLSQLHQMRGRIGRGTFESYCLLVAEPKTEQAQSRVGVLQSCSDGFQIAEEDLRLRGPGEFFGERQHGLTELKIADPLKQFHLLKSSREEAMKLLNDDPKLEKRQNAQIKKQLYRRFPGFEQFIMVG